MKREHSESEIDKFIIGDREILVKGRPSRVPRISFAGLEIIVSGKMLRLASVDDEWLKKVEDPLKLARVLTQMPMKVDIFTFVGSLRDTAPRYNFYTDWDALAVLPIVSYEHWWTNQVNAKTRNMVRKAERKGVSARLMESNDEFFRGITEVFNETPIRQGKPFWHYNKDFDTVKKQFSRDAHRNYCIGAYYNQDLIGVTMLRYNGKFAIVGQNLAKVAHRDKSTSNALMAKAVEVCVEKEIQYLIYGYWGSGTLTRFKKHNGFRRIRLPRYFVPLTVKGKIILRLGLHQGFQRWIPKDLMAFLKRLRKRWYSKIRFGQYLIAEAIVFCLFETLCRIL